MDRRYARRGEGAMVGPDRGVGSGVGVSDRSGGRGTIAYYRDPWDYIPN